MNSIELSGSSLPERLRALPKPPARVFLCGTLPRGFAVAVVGTRHPTEQGRALGRHIAADLASAGVVVVSGGASGIDRAAHEGALGAGGRTLVVAPSGFARPFPEEHRALFHGVVEAGGAYLSLVPDDVPATRSAFFPRNGCLVALADALVLVEAPVRSGARNAVKHARRLGRPVFAVPHSPWNAVGRGCNVELRGGAKLLESARDVLGELPVPGATAAEGGPTQLELGGFEAAPDLAAVWQAVRDGARSVDAVCARAGLPPSRAQAALLALSLDGRLVMDATGVVEPA
ncbi:MAG TPA: DNA-processing protein DprA [Polyangiaceae bacterium]